jgi:histidinol-phosphate aminotransferase
MTARPDPQPRNAALAAYRRPQHSSAIRLKLDGNEGPAVTLEPLLDTLRLAGSELFRRYPDAAALEATLAQRFGVDPAQVLVTAGADEAIDRCCRAFLAPGRTTLIAAPGFEMFDRYTALAGAELLSVPWSPGPFPTADLLARLDRDVAIVAVVSPNNPTGEVATFADVERIAAAAPQALILLDHAYVEYAEEDLTSSALSLPNVIVVRTFSKARGLAGCRVGYAIGPAQLIGTLRAAGGPYPVAAPSLALAGWQLECGAPAMAAHVEQVRRERIALSAFLAARGITPRESQANFVYADFGTRVTFRQAALAAQGIAVRGFAGRPGAENGLRITLPGNEPEFAQLTAALDLVLAPEALLLDLDGVLADVEASYRACVIATARSFGVEVSRKELLAATLAGNANNDWVVTQRLSPIAVSPSRSKPSPPAISRSISAPPETRDCAKRSDSSCRAPWWRRSPNVSPSPSSPVVRARRPTGSCAAPACWTW